jgi:hypothetical protein
MKNNNFVFATTLLLGLALTSCGSSSSSTSSTTGTASSSTTDAGSSTTTTSSSTTHTGGGPGGGGGTSGGGSSSSATYSSDHTYSSGSTTLTDETLTSSSSDNDAVLVNGSDAKVLLNNCTISKSGDTSSADNSSFYGQNASALATNGSLYMNGGSVTSTGEGGAGVAAYSDGVAYAKGVTISTTKNAAGGLHVCGGGTLYGVNNTVTTAGEHSAAIRSDRGGGTMVIENGSYTSTGAGSPAIYCTASINVKGSTLDSEGSEAFAMEGLNTTSLFNCDLTGNMPASEENDGIVWNVICYQSMSGDSVTGTGRFNMVGGNLTAKEGGMFFATNTDAEFYLNNVNLTYSDENPFLLRATKISRWSGDSSPACHFVGEDQTLKGTVVYDTVTSLTLDLNGSSAWTGHTSISTSYTGSNKANINLASGATWTLDANSEVTGNVYNLGTIKGATIAASNGTFGSGDYTLTVDGSYYTTSSGTSTLTAPSFPSYPDFPTSL